MSKNFFYIIKISYLLYSLLFMKPKKYKLTQFYIESLFESDPKAEIKILQLNEEILMPQIRLLEKQNSILERARTFNKERK